MKPSNQIRLFLCLMLSFAASSHATNLYWDADGAGGACDGGAGTWNTGNLFWHTNDCEGSYFGWANSTNDTATFGGSAGYAVALGGTITVNKITNTIPGSATTATLSITPGTGQITLGGTTPTIHTPNKFSVTPPIKGNVVLTKTGAGQLQLNNNNQEISKYIIKGGIIGCANTNKWGTKVGGAQDAVTLDGGGIGHDTNLTPTYNHFGITLGSGGGSIGVYSGTVTVTLNKKITGTGGLNFGGGAAGTAGYSAAGTFVLGSTANDYSGTTTLSKGTLKLGASEVIPNASAVSLAAATTLDFNGFNETIRSLQSSGSGGIVQLGANTMTLDRSSGSTAYAGTIDGSGSIIKNGNATQHLTGINTFSGKVTINAGVLGITSDASLGNAPAEPVADQIKFGGGTLSSSNSFTLNPNRGITLAGNGTWRVDDTSEVYYDGIIAGTGSFTKSGVDTSTLVLGGVNTYQGSTTISGGVLKLGNVNAIPSTSAVAINGSTNKLDLNYNSITVAALSGSGTVSTPDMWTGGVTVNNGRVAAGVGLTNNVVGQLTMQSSLTMANCTNRWELGALVDDTDGIAGTDFDQILMQSGQLDLQSTKISIDFTSSTNAPDFANPFWQTTHRWTVIKMAGGANPSSSGFSGVITNAFHHAGTFATEVDWDGSVALTFTPRGPTAPMFFAQPTNTVVAQGSTATLSTVASGTAPLAYQWYFNNVAVGSGTQSALVLANAQPSNAGTYRVRVSNGSGFINSTNITLTVVAPPTINTQPQSQTVVVGANATFSVAASGTNLFYQWKFNGADIATATQSTYTRTNAQLAHAGNYSVLVTNMAGSVVSSNALLTVNTATPLLATASLSGSSVVLSWPASPGSNYRVEYKANVQDAGWTALAPDVTAVGSTASKTDSVGGSRRFYRVVLLP